MNMYEWHKLPVSKWLHSTTYSPSAFLQSLLWPHHFSRELQQPILFLVSVCRRCWNAPMPQRAGWPQGEAVYVKAAESWDRDEMALRLRRESAARGSSWRHYRSNICLPLMCMCAFRGSAASTVRVRVFMYTGCLLFSFSHDVNRRPCNHGFLLFPVHLACHRLNVHWMFSWVLVKSEVVMPPVICPHLLLFYRDDFFYSYS